MIIKSVHIDKFRAIENIDFDLGTKLTAIVGHNGTMKTTMYCTHTKRRKNWV